MKMQNRICINRCPVPFSCTDDVCDKSKSLFICFNTLIIHRALFLRSILVKNDEWLTAAAAEVLPGVQVLTRRWVRTEEGSPLPACPLKSSSI